VTQPKRLSQEAERTLIRRLKARDERALEELYDLLAPWVLGLALRILQDEDEAEEVVADAFAQVWRRVDKHESERGPLVPWILAIARNRALDALRRRRRWWRKAQRWERAHSAEQGADAGPALHEASALAALPEEQRRVVLLAYFEGLTHSEIARRLDQPLGTVKTRLRIAHQKLSAALDHLRDWTA